MVFSIAYFSTDVLLITPLRCVVVTEKQGIRNNLLRHFHNSAKIDDAKLAALNAAVGAAKTTAEKAAAEAELSVFKPLLPSEIRKFARIVFLYPVTSVIVEGLFSYMAYNQAGSRKSLGDDRCRSTPTRGPSSLRHSMTGRQPSPIPTTSRFKC